MQRSPAVEDPRNPTMPTPTAAAKQTKRVGSFAHHAQNNRVGHQSQHLTATKRCATATQPHSKPPLGPSHKTQLRGGHQPPLSQEFLRQRSRIHDKCHPPETVGVYAQRTSFQASGTRSHARIIRVLPYSDTLDACSLCMNALALLRSSVQWQKNAR